MGRGVAIFIHSFFSYLGRGDDRNRRNTNVLVFPCDLEEIEEVCCRGADLDEVFVMRGDQVGQRGHHEVERALFIWPVQSVNQLGAHDSEGKGYIP